MGDRPSTPSAETGTSLRLPGRMLAALGVFQKLTTEGKSMTDRKLATITPVAAKVAPRVPTLLGAKARRLWDEVLGLGFEIRPDELRRLEDAVREVDIVERLETALRAAPLVEKGSMGQPVPSPLLTEIRQHRALLSKLLTDMRIPDEPDEEEAAATRTTHARRAAQARWSS